MNQKKIALLIETSRAYGRGLLRGIAQYVQVNESWSPRLHPERILTDGIPDWFSTSEFDGVIIRTDSEIAFRSILDSGIPCIDVRAAHDSTAYVVETDDRKVVEMAADHLLDKGHKRIGYCGFKNAVYSDRRLKILRDYLSDKEAELSVFETPCNEIAPTTSSLESGGIIIEPDLVNWLNQLSKPVGVFCCNDVRGNQVLYACLKAGLKVPEEVSVIGVDNDEILCGLGSPPLSSVSNNTRMIGYKAAELLNQLMMGEQVDSPRLQLIPPNRVVARKSTDITVVSDQQLAKALVFIRENACKEIDVSDVVNAVSLSRATLERRFRTEMSRSINDEIKRVRVQRVKQLLSETDFKLSAIARIAGFSTPEYMSTLFKKETGLTPGKFREEIKL